MNKIPNRLLQPPSVKVDALPVKTTLQKLPYDKITWENFEKLCLRLAQTKYEIEDCRQYGVQGDAQGGIDIYAKKESAKKYAVYQCKNVKNFGPLKIRKAIRTFLDGDWVSKTEKFVLCTQEGLNTKQRDDELVNQREILNKKNIFLKVLDKQGLDSELKNYPQIVYDFFGEPWVKAFCGDEVIHKIQVTVPLPEKRKYICPADYISRSIIDSTKSEQNLFVEQGENFIRIIEKENKVALLGWAGTGKSIELQKLVYDLSSDNVTYFPFLIQLNLYTEKSIEEYIPEINNIPQNMIVLCLDGLDEVQSGSFDSVSRKIKEFGVNFPKAKIVVSCRSNFYTTVLENEDLNTLHGFKSFVLANLSSNDVDNYIDIRLPLRKNSFLEEVREKDLESLLHVPFYLIKLSEQYLNNNRISNSKAELFEEVITENIKKDVLRYFPHERDAKEKQMRTLLEKLAFVLEYQGKNYCLWSELQDVFKEKELSIIKRAGALLGGNEGLRSVWKFNHNNIQEYLVAKVLSIRTFEEIKKIIAFKPSFKKAKPSWVNTLSFLISILNNKEESGKKLISWLIKNEPELVIKFEPDRLDHNLRYEIFIKIFSFYKKENRIINRTKFNTSELSKFSMSEITLNYLKQELLITQPISSRSNALELISYYDIETEFSTQREDLKQLIEKNIYDLHASIPYLSIRTYVRIFELNSTDFAKLLNNHVDLNDTWIRFTIFYAIHKQGYQDQYIDLVISQINKLINNEDDIVDRLSNENSELLECIRKVKSHEALIKVVDFINSSYEEIHHSIYFGEIIVHALNLISDLFPADEILFDKIKLFFNSDKIGIYNNQVEQFIQFFKKTKNTARVFKELIKSNSKKLNIYSLNKLALLANEEAIKWLAYEFKYSRIEKQLVVDFQSCMIRHSPLLNLFNQLINEKEKIFLPVYRDFETEAKERDEQTKELLFNRNKFIGAIEQFFNYAGKDQLTYEEIWEIQKTEFQGKFLPIIYEATRLYHKDEIRNKTKLIDWISRNWDSYSISKIIEFLKNCTDTKLTKTQLSYIKKWCDVTSKQVDFTTALSSPRLNTTSANIKAIKLSFLIRRLNIIDYPLELYLDMLSFQRWDDSEEDIFDFVERIVLKDEMDKRVLKNILAGIKYPIVLGNHLNYCTKHKLSQSCSSLISYLNISNHDRYKVLDTYLTLNGDLDQLEKRLPKIKDHFKYKLIEELIKRDSKFILGYLLSTFNYEQNDDAKLKIAGYLIILQNIEGIKFYIDYVKRNKIVPDDSSPSNPLYKFTSTKFLKYIFVLYEMGFNKEIKHDKFNDLKDIAIGAMQNIGLNQNNFPRVKKILFLYKIKFKIKSYLKLHKLPETIILNLDFYFENMEHQYYVNKSLNIDLKEALYKYSLFE